MKPPSKFSILGQRFTVRHAAHVEEDGVELLGWCHSDTQSVLLATHVGPGKAREVYFHEFIHAVLNLVDLNELPKGLTNEQLVSRLSPILLYSLQSNPRVAADLLEKP